MTYREDVDNIIEMLAATYPKAFFVDHRLRLPLKKNVEADLEKAGTKIDPYLLARVMEFYKGCYGYNYAIYHGKKRVDLDGNEVESVTQKERDAAMKHIQETKRLFEEKQRADGPVEVLRNLRSANRITDDAVKKLDAPPMTTIAKKSVAAIAPELTRVHELLMSANSTMLTLQDAAMRAAVAPAALGFVAAELQKVIAEFQRGAA